MSKDCGNHGTHWDLCWLCYCHLHVYLRKPHRRLLAFLLLLIILVLLAVFITWLVLRPSKPSFYIQDASDAQLNLTAPPCLLTTVLQVTLSSRNPNDRIGIYYDSLAAFAQYKGQQITAATVLSAGYQGSHDVIVCTPYLCGAAVLVAPYLTDAFAQDQSAGCILIYIRIEGRLRWKIGPWISGQYNIHANCPAFFTLDSTKSNANPNATCSYSFHFQSIAACNVDILSHRI